MPLLTPERIETIKMVLDAVATAADRAALKHQLGSPRRASWRAFAQELRAIRNGEKGVEGA